MGIIFITYRKPGGYAQDDKWITVHPNGEEHEGRPVLIDDDGRVKNGMGGVWNGTKINEARSDFGKPRSPKRTVLRAIKQWLNQWRAQKKQKDQLLNVENGKFQQVKETLAKAGITLTEISGYYEFVKTPVKTKTCKIFRYIYGKVKTEWTRIPHNVDERCIDDSVNQLLKLSNKFDVIGKPRPLSFGICKFAIGDAIGHFHPGEELIELNTMYYKSQDEYIKQQRDLCEDGTKMPCSEENLKNYTITHEFGHFIQYQVVARELECEGKSVMEMNVKERLNKMAERAEDYKEQILKIAREIYKERGGTDEYDEVKRRDISDYGNLKAVEFFAECFANSQLGKPNILGEAMNRWLKGKGLVRK